MRNDFSEKVKETLAKRVGMRCSNPSCGKLTSGPQTDASKALNIGVAAHITAASPGGLRYDASLSPEQRSSIENGIWLCQSCAKLVDNDGARYIVDLLQTWRTNAELAALKEVEGARRPVPSGSKKLIVLGAIGIACVSVFLYLHGRSSSYLDTANLATPVPIIGSNNLGVVNYANGSGQAATKDDIARLAAAISELRLETESARFPESDQAPTNGQCVVVLATLRKLDRPGRKYVLDTGTCSLFLDGSNTLHFAVKDPAGEEYSVKLETPPDGPLFDRPLYLTCDAGCGEKESFLRIRVNGRSAVRSRVNYDLRLLPPLKDKGPVVGSRADGANPGAFTMIFLAFGHSVLTDKQNLLMMKDVLDFQKGLGRSVALGSNAVDSR
jgi:hypothetical protein